MRINLFYFPLCLSLNLWAGNSFAKTQYNEEKKCGSAQVLSGDTCSNVKVQFYFEGCNLKLEPQVAKQVICDQTTIKARIQEGNYRVEARFEKTKNGWGNVDWKPLGAVTLYRAAKPETKVTMLPIHEPLQTRTPAMNNSIPETTSAKNSQNLMVDQKDLDSSSKIAATESAPVTAKTKLETQVSSESIKNSKPTAASYKFGGFADLRYSNFNAKDNPSEGTTSKDDTGFILEDGAFYGTYNKENVSVFLDVAFRRKKKLDYDTSATQRNISSTSDFALGVDKSQLYLKYKLGSHFSVDFGQFDTIYGVELNDSKDRIFGKTGIVYDYTLPVTHTGVMAEYTQAGYFAKTFLANPNNRGSLGSGDGRMEYGAVVGYGNDFIHGQVGYMARTLTNAAETGVSTRSLFDVIVGTTLGSFALDLEFNQVRDPHKNTLTSLDSTDREDAGQGMLALASYKFSEDFLMGVRYESVKNDPGVVSLSKMDSYGGSLHYKLSSDLELRSEYISYRGKNVSDVTWTDTRFSLGALLLF
ncbi:MAG: porin [Bdellovibrionales bacterium]|nr:porin [Bdellovibrionales bacterium]